MVRKTIVFWLLHMIPEQSDSLQRGWEAKPPRSGFSWWVCSLALVDERLATLNESALEILQDGH